MLHRMRHMQERVDLPGHTRPERLLHQQVRETTEAIVGAVTGSLTAPCGLLLGRYDNHGRLQYTGRTITLARAASSVVAGLLASARRGHPWTGRPFCGRETLDVTRWNPSWWWKWASVSSATPPAGGATPHACTVPALASPPATSPA